MRKENPYRFTSLTDFHRAFGLEKPQHPLVSYINLEEMKPLPEAFPPGMIFEFYKIAYKTNLCGKAKYGQHHYDFGEGGLVFTAPHQVFESPVDVKASGFLLLIHPDFFLSYPLAKKISSFGFFSYSANEALHLSEKEKNTILSVCGILEEELQARIDDFSQDVVISQIELLLAYSNRFYRRQFITRRAVSSNLLQRLDDIMEEYFDSETVLTQGLPTVQLLAKSLNVSPPYLSDMLRSLTGRNAQQHIHDKLIEKAKEKLSVTGLSISEIAYGLGFEYPQSFSRFFKTKTKQSPVEFRQSFN